MELKEMEVCSRCEIFKNRALKSEQEIIKLKTQHELEFKEMRNKIILELEQSFGRIKYIIKEVR